eukprot:scaffold81012_cov53-Phaeocystis_antarctica.AAC.1
MAAKQTVGSMLIKPVRAQARVGASVGVGAGVRVMHARAWTSTPVCSREQVQRLCKYPLLFRELCKEVPENHSAHGEVLQAALEIKDVAAKINERVREAEQRSLMMSLAEA